MKGKEVREKREGQKAREIEGGGREVERGENQVKEGEARKERGWKVKKRGGEREGFERDKGKGKKGGVKSDTIPPLQDGTKVLTASCDKTCKVWDLQSNQAVAFAQHAAPVKSVRWVQSPNYQLAITGSWDKTIKVRGVLYLGVIADVCFFVISFGI